VRMIALIAFAAVAVLAAMVAFQTPWIENKIFPLTCFPNSSTKLMQLSRDALVADLNRRFPDTPTSVGAKPVAGMVLADSPFEEVYRFTFAIKSPMRERYGAASTSQRCAVTIYYGSQLDTALTHVRSYPSH
jgi:hypothetical protein